MVDLYLCCYSTKRHNCSHFMLSTLEIHTLVQSNLGFSERMSCNYKGHSDHTLRTLFHMRHNGFISGVINTNCEWCTGACRATRDFPAVRVQVKGTYTITGNSSTQQKYTEYLKRKRHQRGLECTPFPSRNEDNKKDKQSKQRWHATLLQHGFSFSITKIVFIWEQSDFVKNNRVRCVLLNQCTVLNKNTCYFQPNENVTLF